MKKILTIVFTIMTIATVNGQTTKYTGYFCTGMNELSPFKYTREYKQDGDNYITLYKIYSPTEGYYLNITATHYKSENKIIISIDDITVKVGGHVSTQELTYEEPSVKIFGWPGMFKETYDAQNVLPNELALKFVSNKFQNVKVVSIVNMKMTV